MKYKLLYLDSHPIRSPSEGNAGYDLPNYEGKLLKKGIPTSFSTGVAVEIPEGLAGLILGRSGNAFTKDVYIVYDDPESGDDMAHKGLIDSSYRGEVKVKLLSMKEDIYIPSGVYIAQMIVIPVYTEPAVEYRELSGSLRGEQGFGSSGTV